MSSASDVSLTSYPTRLEEFAEHFLRKRGSSEPIEVLNRGFNGDLTSGMLDRFDSDVIAEKPAFVIILGGANDIGWGLDPVAIACNLASMYDAARKEGIGPVACSVPSILGFDELIPPRLSLNRMTNVEAKKRKVPFVDLFSVTANQTNNRLLEIYSADGLHLNPQGYEQIAKHVFDNWLEAVLDAHILNTISGG